MSSLCVFFVFHAEGGFELRGGGREEFRRSRGGGGEIKKKKVWCCDRKKKKKTVLTDRQQLPELRGGLELHRQVRGPDALDHRWELGEGLKGFS